VTQLTNDGKVKGNSGRLVTDGSRVYFVEGSVGSYQIAQVAATGGPEPMAFRVRLADHKVETITSLKSVLLAIGPSGNTQFGVAPDGSPVFTRDTGTTEIYALTVKWP
jgi:hypothetical protein